MERAFINYFPWGILLIVISFIALLFFLALLYVSNRENINFSFQKLGFFLFSGFTMFISILLGIAINIPFEAFFIKTKFFCEVFVIFFGIFYKILKLYLKVTIIPLILSSAVITTFASVYRFIKVLIKENIWTIFSIFFSLIGATFIIYLFAKQIKDLVIAISIFVPFFISVLTISILKPIFSHAFAYIYWMLNNFFKANILNLKKIEDLAVPIISIGDVCDFDRVFLTESSQF